MIGVIDLKRTPPQYDVFTALVTCEIERIRRGEPDLEIVFAAGPRDGHRDTDSWPKDTRDRELLMERLALPGCRLLPSARRVSRCTARRPLQGEFGFDTKLYGLGPQLKALADPNGRPLRIPGVRPEHDPDLVVITLREATHWPERNSQVGEWIKAAVALNASGYRVIIVRDTAKAFEEIAGLETAPGASLFVDQRAALYSRAAVNLFVNSGPALLAAYMRLPLIIFRPVCETHRASSTAYMAQHAIKPGDQLPGAPAWEWRLNVDDTAPEIVDAAMRFLNGEPRP